MTQAHILYSGRVQGVGFRFSVRRYATNLELKGWVKNLPDGRVEALVEGDKDKIQELCRDIKSDYAECIHDMKINFQEAEEKYKEFEVTF